MKTFSKNILVLFIIALATTSLLLIFPNENTKALISLVASFLSEDSHYLHSITKTPFVFMSALFTTTSTSLAVVLFSSWAGKRINVTTAKKFKALVLKTISVGDCISVYWLVALAVYININLDQPFSIAAEILAFIPAIALISLQAVGQWQKYLQNAMKSLDDINTKRLIIQKMSIQFYAVLSTLMCLEMVSAKMGLGGLIMSYII